MQLLPFTFAPQQQQQEEDALWACICTSVSGARRIQAVHSCASRSPPEQKKSLKLQRNSPISPSGVSKSRTVPENCAASFPPPERAIVPKKHLKAMSERGTYYHLRLDLSPTALLRWARALTGYPQSWTCLNVRHVDSLRQKGILFSPQTPLMNTRVRSLRVTPTQTLAETPYCLNKWVSWAFICPNFLGRSGRTVLL